MTTEPNIGIDLSSLYSTFVRIAPSVSVVDDAELPARAQLARTFEGFLGQPTLDDIAVGDTFDLVVSAVTPVHREGDFLTGGIDLRLRRRPA